MGEGMVREVERKGEGGDKGAERMKEITPPHMHTHAHTRTHIHTQTQKQDVSMLCTYR